MMPTRILIFAIVASLSVLGCTSERATTPTNVDNTQEDAKQMSDKSVDEESVVEETVVTDGTQKATFGAGCYWCTEAVFQRLKGVDGVVSGFMGGQTDNPSYEAVCSGTTGHAEVIQFDYDPEVISFEDLLEVFWKTHDPTTLNQQGADKGTQYRSVVFFHNDAQKELAEKYKQKLNEANAFENPVVTEISPAEVFYAAKAAHQNYYNANPNQGYCRMVVKPKVDKVQSVFADKLK